MAAKRRSGRRHIGGRVYYMVSDGGDRDTADTAVFYLRRNGRKARKIKLEHGYAVYATRGRR